LTPYYCEQLVLISAVSCASKFTCICRLFLRAGSSGVCTWASAQEDAASAQQHCPADVDMASCSSCPAQQSAAGLNRAESVAAMRVIAGSSAGKAAAAAKKAPDPHKDSSMVPGVNTGEDVVAFYGRNGQDSSVKFFYCVRCVSCIAAASCSGPALGLLQVAGMLT
jgi:hypothetical protein